MKQPRIVKIVNLKWSALNNPQRIETERFSEIFCGTRLQDLVDFLRKPCKFERRHEAEETHDRAG